MGAFENCAVCGEWIRAGTPCPRCGFVHERSTGRSNAGRGRSSATALADAFARAGGAKGGERGTNNRPAPGKASLGGKRRSASGEGSQAPGEELPARGACPSAAQPSWRARRDDEPVRVDPKATDGAGNTRRSLRGSRRRGASVADIRTQVSDGACSEERDLIIGFDLGTACTKVVIRDDPVAKAYAVPFGEYAYPGHPYLVATEMAVTPDGAFHLGGEGQRLNDLKIKLLGNPGAVVLEDTVHHRRATALEACAAYVALVIREVLRWFVEEQASVYRNVRLLWQVNIGMPSRDYDDERLVRTFRALARAGWQAAVRRGPVTVASIRRALEECGAASAKDDPDGLHPDDVKAVPEVIAEVVGYAQSRLRREGMHLLVDIGAGTIDVSTFNLNSWDGDDRFSMLTCEVAQLGAFALHRQRVLDIAALTERKLSALLGVADGIRPIPEIAAYQPVNVGELESVDRAFRERIQGLLGKVIVETKRRRDPRSSAWKDGLPVFLCGGGSAVPLYDEAVTRAGERIQAISHFKRLELPRPEDFEAPGLAPGGFRRLAVAYGLSTRFDKIGEIVPPRAIDDIELGAPSPVWRDRYIDKDQV